MFGDSIDSASLCVVGTSRPYPSATLEGPAHVRTTAIGADTGDVMARIPYAPYLFAQVRR